MKINLLLKGLMLTSIISLFACSSENDPLSGNDETKKGMLSLDMSATINYRTKAINESDYANADNYTVNILNSDNVVTESYLYKDMPLTIPLGAGSYTLKAHKGKDEPASITGMYVEGSNSFEIESGKTTSASVVCKPVCAKVIMEYDNTMDDYFSNYAVLFETKAIGTGKNFSLANKATTPVYLRVDANEKIKVQISMTKKSDGTTAIIDKEFTVSPQTALTLSVKPAIVQGNLGISITIDESTNDKDVIVEIPADWATAK